STLSTRKVATQEKELTLKIIIYNLEKKIKMTLFIVIFRLNTFQQDPILYLVLAKSGLLKIFGW
ncbi:MAG: hypothetical protein V1735_00665, partial [Nanoarchaeota archaeon]